MTFSQLVDQLTPDQVTPFGISVVALFFSLLSPFVAAAIGMRSTRIARQANASKILVDLFEEHRQPALAEARHFIHHELPKYDQEQLRRRGLIHLPREKRTPVRDLMWLYDHIGLLVAYRYTELEPVAAYLGGSVVDTWQKVEPLVEGERRQREKEETADQLRYQAYFQALAEQVEGLTVTPPGKLIRMRKRSRLRQAFGGGRTIARKSD